MTGIAEMHAECETCQCIAFDAKPCVECIAVDHVTARYCEADRHHCIICGEDVCEDHRAGHARKCVDDNAPILAPVIAAKHITSRAVAEVGQSLRRRRLALGIGMREMGRLLDTDQSLIVRMEAGRGYAANLIIRCDVALAKIERRGRAS